MVFLPWVAATKSLGELHDLRCWLSKHANRTSKVLSDLLKDKKTTRHLTLQNRAAVDFLLLVHGHGCQDFEGLCCFNLSDHSQSISQSTQLLKKEVDDLKTEKDPERFEIFFGHLGLKGWDVSFLNNLLWIFIVILIAVLMFSGLLKSLKKAVTEVFFINKEGAVVVAPRPSTDKLTLPWRASNK